MVTYRPQIDETNEEVQKLLDARMGSSEECIRAIEMYGTAHIATNHMMETELDEEDEGLFQGAPVQRAVEVLPSQHIKSVYYYHLSLEVYLYHFLQT